MIPEGIIRTPYGLLREAPPWIEGERAIAIRAIQNCVDHRAPCSCWRPTRERLRQAALIHGNGRSTEAWLAGELLLEMEHVERAPRHLRRIWNTDPVFA